MAEVKSARLLVGFANNSTKNHGEKENPIAGAICHQHWDLTVELIVLLIFQI